MEENLLILSPGKSFPEKDGDSGETPRLDGGEATLVGGQGQIGWQLVFQGGKQFLLLNMMGLDGSRVGGIRQALPNEEG